jgi:sulfhydrogenase subunit beta (sulfur reductase)
MARAGPAVLLDHDGLQAMLGGLSMRGYAVVGPKLRDGAIVYDRIANVADLPAGWTDRWRPRSTGWNAVPTRPCSATP